MREPVRDSARLEHILSQKTGYGVSQRNLVKNKYVLTNKLKLLTLRK